MSPLIYLSLSRLKNTIRDLFRKPARLIYVVFLVALFVLAIGGNQSWSSPELYRDPREMVAMATALFLFIFLYMVWNGFSKGGTIFSLSDVNLIFPSPIGRTRALFYGLFRQIGTVLLVGLFLFYQYGWLHNLYNITMGTMVVIFLCYCAAVFLGQVTAMTIYSFTSSQEGVQKALKVLIIVLGLLELAWLLWGVWNAPEDRLGGLIQSAVSLPVQVFPVAGWLGWAFAGWLGMGAWSPVMCGVAPSAGFPADSFRAGLVRGCSPHSRTGPVGHCSEKGRNHGGCPRESPGGFDWFKGRLGRLCVLLQA